MEKLNLEYLAPYLPQDLRIFNIEVNSSYIMSIYTMEQVIATPKIFKPILRPLSDLIKEIEVDGEKFVPIYYILEQWDSLVAGGKPYTQKDLPLNCVYWEYWQVDYMFKWHFDVFGLIEKGLAVDINTIK